MYNMVRIMVGTLIEIGKGERKPEDIERILISKDREQAGPTISPQGLFLLDVEY